MPQMGESIAEGTVSRWLKKIGDSVKRDEPIFEISTDKVDAEIPSPAAGVLVEIIIGEGQTVAVQTIVARLETDAAIAASGAAPTPVPIVVADAPVARPALAIPAAAVPAAPSSSPVVSGPAGSFEERIRTKSSPLVRKIAAEQGVPLSQLSGSGIAGRVTKKDLDAFLAATPATRLTSTATESHGPLPTPWAGDTVETMSKIRRLTSEHMTLARRTAAHVTSFFEVDLTRVARIRQAMRKDFEAQTGQKLTYLPFILQAVGLQLKRHPVLNAAVAGTDVIYRKSINLGIAVALDPSGLIVPVVKHADELSLTGLTKTVNDLAARARSKKLNPIEVQDATFTVTNPGVFGSLSGTPIIPVGTTAILCLGAIEKRAKVLTGPDGEDTIAIRTCAYFSISFDHRVVDGADADRFMSDLKKSLETIPETGF
ncbi:MAG: 2-oxo acid dehydrogenase subunit E2 [Gemmatimonadaceae bacterium]|nr:2-oxo acid dehydrogenase subunit E2 [Gemmatimonadaceae bacterium]